MKQRKIPLRKCIACQEMLGKKTLIRIVRSPEGEISIDTTGKKPGRGAYLCGKSDCFARIKKNRQLDRSLNIQVGEAIYEALESELAKVKFNES